MSRPSTHSTSAHIPLTNHSQTTDEAPATSAGSLLVLRQEGRRAVFRRFNISCTAGQASTALQAAQFEQAGCRDHRGLRSRWFMRERDHAAAAHRTLLVVELGGDRPQIPRYFRGENLTQLSDVQIAVDEVYYSFLVDVIKYFALGHRRSLMERFKEQLRVADRRPTMIVSHSLGTVVVYDVLLTGQYYIDTWVTLGSPLAYAQRIRGRLRHWPDRLTVEQLKSLAENAREAEKALAASHRVRRELSRYLRDILGQSKTDIRRGGEIYNLPPPRYPDRKVDRWFNVFDPRDPIVAPPFFPEGRLAPLYLSGEKPRIFDVVIDNQGPNRHSEMGYLSTVQLAWLIRDFLARNDGRAHS